MNKKNKFLSLGVIMFLFYFITLTSCDNTHKQDLSCTVNDEIDSYRLSANVIQFYIEIDYIDISGKKEQYAYNFDKYEKILKNLNQFKNEILNALEEGKKTEINKKTTLFINNCIEYSEKDKEVIFLIKKLKLKELSINVDKCSSKKNFIKRKANAYKLLLNATLVSQLMIDKLKNRRILIYPFRE